VEITVVGPLTYNETKVYLFRLVDVFSKWMCFHKLNSLDPKEISKILLKEFSVLGFPVGIRLVDGEVDLHQNEIDHSPKVNSECSNLPNSEELTNCPVEVNGDGNNNSNSSIGDNNETGDTNNNDNGDNDNNSSSSNNNNNSSNTNEADITPVEKTEEQSDFKPDEIKTTEIEVEEANKESVSDLTNSIPNGSDSVLQENTLNSTLENEILLQRINESDDFLINKINDFEIFLDNQNEDTKPFIYIFIGEKSIVDSETENLYKDKLEKFINHFPDLWVEYLPNFILNVQSSASSSFQTPSQVMFHREPNLIGLFESSYLNHSIQFLGNSVENQPPVKNDVANGSCKYKSWVTHNVQQLPKHLSTDAMNMLMYTFIGIKEDCLHQRFTEASGFLLHKAFKKLSPML
ncbi:autophagy protein 5-like, partial [Centruroides sculpturatus]|uniref:autophagy protein 5-like n=1 Tax=Centruroides sculpturatus TaxID=218467 RepID=UPI000C6D73C1